MLDARFDPLAPDEVTAAPTAPTDTWSPITPVPSDAPRTVPPHRLGKPSARWAYRDRVGALNGLTCRFDTADGKQILPLTYCRNAATGETAWRWQGFHDPRPLYGLDKLDTKLDATLLVVEGEKAADAAQAQFPECVVVTSPGGSNAAAKADWSALKGRRVVVWPDADDPGRRYAADVARLLMEAGAASVAVVDVPTDWPKGWDLADPLPEGVSVGDLRRMLDAALPVDAAEPPPMVDGDEWPEPEPLTANLDPEPYPIDALPETIRAAVMEVQGFVKAPVPMVAASALAALSIAAQGHCDVQRAVKLTGPTSLNLLTVADSGERKSTLDGFFTAPIREFEASETARLEPEVQAHRAAMGAWTAKRDGLKEAIKAGAKTNKDTSVAEADLVDMERSAPVAPRVPKVLRGDDTPEALSWSLAKEWPSSAVVSSEAGLILGAHGMGRETIMRNLSQLNVLWDGGALSVGRKTSESYTVRGARLTVALQIQEPTIRAFFDGSKGLARGTGFLARFLVCWPASTQGTRRFTEAPPSWPALSSFHRQITALLTTPAPIDDDGALTPYLLTLAPDAKAAWVAFHDALEGELGAGGELADVRDVAAKTADNAARLAALFHALEWGCGGQIQANHMEAGCRVAAWHLSESRRFFGEVALPPTLADAVRIERFLVDQCRRGRVNRVPRRDAQRHGPVRDGDRLDAALVELAEARRILPVADGKQKLIAVNPALLAGGAP